MSDEPQSAPVTPDPPAPVQDKTPLSMDDAVSALKERLSKPPSSEPVQREEDAPAPEPTSVETEETTQAETAEEPAIEPPKSWTKEAKEAFRNLDPISQQAIADVERKREVEFRRGQNSVAEERKAATAEREQAAEQRRQYEEMLPRMLDRLSASHSEKFADVKNWADVQQMAANDPVRYVQWQAEQGQIQGLQQEAQQAHQRQQQESVENLKAFAKEQSDLFWEKSKDLDTPEKRTKASQEAISYLNDLGVTKDELDAVLQRGETFSFHDHRVQLMIRDAARFRAAQAALKAKVAAPLPPVQKPGASSGSPNEERIQALSSRLDKTGSVADAVALWKARR